MRPLLCTFLLAVSTCMAHFDRGIFDSRNLIEREEPIRIDKYDLVECPVCESTDWRYREETCEVIENKRVKKCYYGVYKNRACGNRFDCYRGVDEDCMMNDDQDIRCKPGSHCTELKKCSGSDDPEQNERARTYMFVSANRWPLKTRRNLYSKM